MQFGDALNTALYNTFRKNRVNRLMTYWSGGTVRQIGSEVGR